MKTKSQADKLVMDRKEVKIDPTEELYDKNVLDGETNYGGTGIIFPATLLSTHC